MLTLSVRSQLVIGVLLAALMAATRMHSFVSFQHLPPASWAVFFLAGVYLRPHWAFAALFTLAVVLDVIAVTIGGVDDSCISLAYGFLLPAYGSLWFAGRWYARRHRPQWSALMPLGLSVLLGAVVCELFSSGSFYYLSGYFAEPDLAELGARLVWYFPQNLRTVILYVGFAALLHVVFVYGLRVVRVRESTQR